MKENKNLVVAAVAAAAIGFWLASSPASPFAPQRHDRPVLRFIAKVAKSFLWVALVAEPAPEAVEETYLVHAKVGPDGQPELNHARGW